MELNNSTKMGPTKNGRSKASNKTSTTTKTTPTKLQEDCSKFQTTSWTSPSTASALSTPKSSSFPITAQANAALPPFAQDSEDNLQNDQTIYVMVLHYLYLTNKL